MLIRSRSALTTSTRRPESRETPPEPRTYITRELEADLQIQHGERFLTFLLDAVRMPGLSRMRLRHPSIRSTMPV